MKTVFLFLRQGISNRNLLRTDFLKVLKDNPEVRVVVVSPIGDEPGFREEFEARNVCVERWPRTRVGFWEKRLKNLKDYVWVSRGLTQAIRVRRLAQRGKWGLRWRDGIGSFAKTLGISEGSINDWEMGLYRSSPALAPLYEKYHPDLVVFTRLFGTNLHVVKEAKKRHVPVLCLVESWDNFICKGPLSVIPDRMAVWNRSMVDEAHELHGFPADRVEVVGVPQFDLYMDESNFLRRDEFCEIYGLDPAKKLITYAASTEGFIPDEPDVVERVYQGLQKVKETMPVQLMLRLHPITSTPLRDEYLRRFSGRPDLIVQRPGRVSKLHDGWDPSWADMVHLASTIHHSSVIVNIASTMAIDAAVLDKPVVAVAFGGTGKKTRSKFFDDIFEHSHYRNLAVTGGLHIVQTPEELVDAVRVYLDNPAIDADGRNRLRESLCFQLDGQAGARAAAVVLRQLGLADIPIASADDRSMQYARVMG
ncbi:MAG TPA: hypothetical protein VLX11_07195 [Candidatus Acidoferrales bacterium]|nr:hypothetical protein [Candidatus Acidoferrales bacterium]